ncbi:MAG: hypothetical protein ACKOEQ_02575, partial [Verrucomicrobiota bacterium]
MVSRLATAWLAVCLALPVLAGPRQRRILYNLDGDSCMTLKAGRVGPGPISTNDLVTLVAELARPGSQVDTLLVCINAQVMYYPTRVGTQRGALSTPAEQVRNTQSHALTTTCTHKRNTDNAFIKQDAPENSHITSAHALARGTLQSGTLYQVNNFTLSH